MTENKRFSVGLRKCTTQYEIIDNWKTGEYPFIEPFYYEKTAKDLAKFLNALNDENDELRLYNREMVKDIKNLEERNDRQAEQLDRLYKLIEDKDWRALSDIIDDFKRCEEQLQKEWRQYE